MELPSRFTDQRYYKTRSPTVLDEDALGKRAGEFLANLLEVASDLISYFELSIKPREYLNSIKELALILIEEFRPNLSSIPNTESSLTFAFLVIEHVVPAATLTEDSYQLNVTALKAHLFTTKTACEDYINKYLNTREVKIEEKIVHPMSYMYGG